MPKAADLLAAIMADDEDDIYEPANTTVVAFEIKKFVLQVMLDKAITVVPTRDVMPVLKCFQFQVDAQRLRIVASDLEMTLIVSTPMVSVTHPGTVVFPAKKLAEIVKSADDTDVKISVKGTTARIAIGRASWTLQLEGGYDYPAMAVINEAEFTTIDRKVLTDAILSVRYAASRDPSRANLNIIDIHDGKLTACDGSRIQQITISKFPVNLRIPISAVDDLLRLMKITDLDTIDVGQSTDKLIFRFGGDVFIVSKFHAQFPDMEAQMLRPAMENRHRLDCDRSELLDAIRRVRINADVGSSAIALSIDAATVTVAAKDTFSNTATETIDAVFTGPPRTVMVNHRYLVDMINTNAEPTCTFRLGDDTKTRRTPILLNTPNGATGVIQQMNMDWVS